MHNYQAPKELRIGHIHLKVSNLERSISFYREVLGFNLLFNEGSFAFLSVNNYHHHIGLNTWQSHGKEPGPQRAPGLYHFALNYPTQTDLGCIVKRLIEKQWPIEGSADHTSHLAVYTHDPDNNGIELAWDRDESFWRGWLQNPSRAEIDALNKPLNIEELLKNSGF